MTTQTAPQSLLDWLDDAIRVYENTAQAAAALQDDPENGWGIVDDSDYAQPSERRYIAPHIGLTHEPQSAEHIVLHNPAAVLRRCAADRKLIAAHGPWTDEERTLIGVPASDQSCKGCGFNNQEEPMVADYRHCPVLLALAEGYGWTAGA